MLENLRSNRNQTECLSAQNRVGLLPTVPPLLSRLAAPALTWETVNPGFTPHLNLARQNLGMATKLPKFGEIRSSLPAPSREGPDQEGERLSPSSPQSLSGSPERLRPVRGLSPSFVSCSFSLRGSLYAHLLSSDCLPSRRLLRAVKCLLPVYCVSNCSRGGENISQFT